MDEARKLEQQRREAIVFFRSVANNEVHSRHIREQAANVVTLLSEPAAARLVRQANYIGWPEVNPA